jgi:hypothetical protein
MFCSRPCRAVGAYALWSHRAASKFSAGAAARFAVLW